MLKVWVVTAVHDYGCDNVLGIYLTEEAAKKAHKGQWGPYDHAGTIGSNRNLRLFSRTISKKGLDPLQKLAFDILKGDPMALDAARDILKC